MEPLVTTTTIAQAAQSESSDVWVPFLAALLGGFLALVGSVVVKRWELRKTTRVRIYDVLQPALFEEYRVCLFAIRLIDRGVEKGPVPPPTRKFVQLTGELHRAGVIAGWTEAQITERIWELIGEHTAYDTRLNPTWNPNKDFRELVAMDQELERLADKLQYYLERKLKSRFRRLMTRARAWTIGRISPVRKRKGKGNGSASQS
jgi:hypothetical protein